MAITRRDFLNGVALAIGTSTLLGCGNDDTTKTAPKPAPATTTEPPKGEMVGQEMSEYYPPQKLGLRGDHDGSFEIAHQLSWQKKQYDLTTAEDKGEYDLVVVGAGLSGLLCAYEFHKTKPDASILILDNHDDFGGHAQRNEFHFDGGMRISFGGSESFDHPSTKYGKDILKVFKELGIDYKKFETYYDQTFNERHDLHDTVFFSKSVFGQARVLKRESILDGIEQVNDMPLSEEDRAFWQEMIENPKDYLRKMPKSKREDFLNSISYDKFLKEYVKPPAGVMKVLEEICLEYWGFSIDHLPALDAVYDGYPAMGNLIDDDEEEDEPYIHHFPDGNAGLARLLVRALIPAVSTSKDYDKFSPMEAIVLDKFDYHQLDKDEHNVKLRLNATCVLAKNVGDKVELGYHQAGKLYKITAHNAIMACNHRLMPYLVPEMPQPKKDAFAQAVRVPLIYTKILVKNWQAFKTLNTHTAYAPKCPYVLIMLDYPVNMGGYKSPDKPDEPMIVHMVRIPVPYGAGKDVREACQIGRREVYGKSFAELEKEAIDQLNEFYGVAGESLTDKIMAVTINRWSHGYSYEQNILYDSESESEAVFKQVQAPIGNIHFANSDAHWEPYVEGALNQGFRAVREVLKKK